MLAAIDFTTVEVWTKGGLVTFYLLFVMELKTRRVHFAGCLRNPNERWMTQIARNLTDPVNGFLIGKRHVLMDRDGKFCPAFCSVLKAEGVEPLLLPPRSPDLNAYIERFFQKSHVGMRRADDLLWRDLATARRGRFSRTLSC